MTYNEREIFRGRIAMLNVDDLRVRVKILDTRRVFGRIDHQVSPEAGFGTQWVSADRVTILSNPPQSIPLANGGGVLVH